MNKNLDVKTSVRRRMQIMVKAMSDGVGNSVYSSLYPCTQVIVVW